MNTGDIVLFVTDYISQDRRPEVYSLIFKMNLNGSGIRVYQSSSFISLFNLSSFILTVLLFSLKIIIEIKAYYV
jgi:hypothetical protein